MLGNQGRLAVRDAWRSIVRFPGTSVAAVFILALNMAVGVVTFAVVDTIVLRPLPYPESDTLVDISMRTQKTSRRRLAGGLLRLARAHLIVRSPRRLESLDVRTVRRTRQRAGYECYGECRHCSKFFRSSH